MKIGWYKLGDFLVANIPIYKITNLLARLMEKCVPRETAACWQPECIFKSGCYNKTICSTGGVIGHFKHSFVHL